MSMILPTYFISHGGGPWTHMKDQLGSTYDALEASLKAIPGDLGGVKPQAVLVVSGHWEEAEFSVMSNPSPPMVYDYSGFPAHTYQIRYGAPGSPDMAERVRELLRAAGLTARLDPQRGYDHGTFVPLYAIYPAADVPVLQLSLKQGYDPAVHVAAGRALAPLRDEGVLLIGSGLSYHNLRAMGPAAHGTSKAFDDWLQETLVHSEPDARLARLLAWERAPAARQAHPREDHLLPLMVAVGASEHERAQRIYHEEGFFGGVVVSSFRFGEPVTAAAYDSNRYADTSTIDSSA